MQELQDAIHAEQDERKRAKLQKKLAKIEKYMEKVKIEPSANTGSKKEKRRIEFEQSVSIEEGKKKDVTELDGQFNPLNVEAGWCAWWERMQYFAPEYKTKKRNGKKYVMVLPPPNITGSLHIGHAMMTAIQDSVVRMKRMQGYETLYLPGTDHAGIGTQVVVEKALEKEGKTRREMGREKFVERVWEWKEQYGRQIISQFKRLGSSLDFTRERFTMDRERTEAVTEAFVRLYEQGLIYRGYRLVNWCAKIQTSLSDLEVDYVDVEEYEKVETDGGKYVFGRMFTVQYEIEQGADGSGESREKVVVNVSTTRPETIFGDVALCANPNDKRYVHLDGCTVINPLTGERMRFILDEAAEMEFGTGVLKITPAHDVVDFEIGERHGLERVCVIDKDNRMSMGPFKGDMRFVAREKTVKLLKEQNKLVSEEGHKGSVPICSRTGDVVEPRLIPQWWMRCKELSSKALNATCSNEEGDEENNRSGNEDASKLQILPAEMRKTWHAWLSNIKDWCLSRQLWWGHRIPAYTANGMWYIARTKEEAEIQAGCAVEQDEDVLDTWFSSGLWPFATMGWPKETEDMEKYYPNTILETGKDIIFFWVARMVMMGIALTGKIPFRTVLFHSIVRDAKGEKMSKSKGNVIDPVDVISGITLEGLLEKLEKGNLGASEIKKARKNLSQEFPHGIEACGSDALRFALLSSASLGRDVNLSVEKVVSCRRLCNKIWNAMKYVLAQKHTDNNRSAFHKSVDRWIQSRLAHTIESVTKSIEEYQFMKATTEAQQYIVYEFCDFYVELCKGRTDVQGIEHMRRMSLEYIKLVHPILPFITEEIYQVMKHKYGGDSESDAGESTNKMHFAESITIDAYPEKLEAYEEDETKIEAIIEIIKAVRSHITNNKIAQPKLLEIELCDKTEIVAEEKSILERMLSVEVVLVRDLVSSTSCCGVHYNVIV